VVVKTLKPECQDVALAINEIEGELEIHSRLDHTNIVSLIGAGFTPRGVRFVVLERLDGGTLTQLLGYDNRIRDRRRRFWTKKKISYMDVLKCARSMADALAYCHGRAIPNAMVMHRDLKPDNIGKQSSSVLKECVYPVVLYPNVQSLNNLVFGKDSHLMARSN
jgi:serine/threonine protein kinase